MPKCECDSCKRYKRVKAVMNKLDEADRKVISDLMDDLGHAEEDLSIDRIILDEYRHRHGGIGFSEACDGADKRHAEKSKQ